ncbi:MAG: 1-(5-phosphoribosyl)-5-[(5-phosphoribosylamino)methylideneamino]imidazole-4-carboxamide isomerase [Candidatus Spyradocola sp.]|jgi:phosphoribosylformimino-5-aminoimidazole carboxamide ribotide isomerase
MQIYPAIDIKGGRAVRLRQGLAEDVTDYGTPAEAAMDWKNQGATYLHVVDLDGAFEGRGKNLPLVAQIVAETKLPVELGGGIRTMEDIEARLSLGVARVILGTVALENPELVRRACALYPGRIACGIDAKDGRVAVRGWVEDSDVAPVDLALRMRDAGVMDVIYTDIRRDGMQTGPNVESTAELVRKTGMRIIGSGGVGKLQDLYDLRDAGCAGAIVGKALYNGNFTLAEARRLEAE